MFGIVFSSLVLTACSNATLKSQDKLIEKPISNEQNYEIYNEVRQRTPLDASFIFPQNSSDVGRINVEDLDGDEIPEIIAFKKKTTDSKSDNNVYAYIFKTKKKGNKLSIINDSEKIIKIEGDSIKYANFIDMNNNKKKELVIQVISNGSQNIYVYETTSSELDLVAKYEAGDEKSGSIRLNSYNYGGKSERCLSIIQDPGSSEVNIAEMRLDGGRITFVNPSKLNNFESLDKISMKNGRVSKNRYGTVLSYQDLSGNILSQIIIYDKGRFLGVFGTDNDKLKNPYRINSSDVGEDDILQIPKIRGNNTYEKKEKIISWYRWNGEFGEQNSLDIQSQLYYNFYYNFKLRLNKKLFDLLYTEKNIEDSQTTINFGYVDTIKNKYLFSISIISKSVASDYDSKTKKSLSNIIYENEEYVYTYKALNQSNLNEVGLDFKKVKDAFELINK